MKDTAVHLSNQSTNARGYASDGYFNTIGFAMVESRFDQKTGKVRTQHDMTPEEIKKLEKKYGAKIRMDVEVPTHGTMDDESICNGWYYKQHRRRKLAKEALDAEKGQG
tara:strand:- start:191 stop:517 length:327 start_codon:yes stop_codon:yes gene_type:complete